MGSGKSTLGPIIANVLGFAFLDLDVLIEAQAGRPVQQVFEEDGEPAFRRLEAAALQSTAGRDRVVVSLGGGALTIEENLVWALEHGTVVYLHTPLDVLTRRLRRGRSVRPLLLDGKGRKLSFEALRERVSALMEQREPYYRRAHVVVEMGHLNVGQTVDAVVRALRRPGMGLAPRGTSRRSPGVSRNDRR